MIYWISTYIGKNIIFFFFFKLKCKPFHWRKMSVCGCIVWYFPSHFSKLGDMQESFAYFSSAQPMKNNKTWLFPFPCFS